MVDIRLAARTTRRNQNRPNVCCVVMARTRGSTWRPGYDSADVIKQA